jgi:hypothetical protein
MCVDWVMYWVFGCRMFSCEWWCLLGIMEGKLEALEGLFSLERARELCYVTAKAQDTRTQCISTFARL